jgi:hypothetical protein
LNKTIELGYESKLYSLLEKNKISEEQFDHFLRRGIQIILPSQDFGLSSLGRILPEIVIGASTTYISTMKIPYQATSYLAANIKKENNDKDTRSSYIYKLPGKPAGGVPLLTGGKRKIGDNVFASTHRIMIGFKAVIVSALNLMVNKDKIWNWHFFGDHIKELNPDIYQDLVQLEEQLGQKNTICQIVVSRSAGTFKKLRIAEFFYKNKIAVLDPNNNTKVIFITDQKGYDYACRKIPPSDLIDYVVTGEEFDIYQGMLTLRRKYSINIMLNDGGRQFSNGLRDAGLLAEERVTLEPNPGETVIPDVENVDPASIMAMNGIGLDGREIEGAVMVHSTDIQGEKANVYAYPMDEAKVI